MKVYQYFTEKGFSKEIASLSQMKATFHLCNLYGRSFLLKYSTVKDENHSLLRKVTDTSHNLLMHKVFK